MRVTVCQLHEAPEGIESDWPRLVEHVEASGSDLVLLPEMPFHPWLARTREVDEGSWEASVASHDRWMERLSDLAPAVVLGTRPVTLEGRRLNEGFVWDAAGGYRGVHHKYYLPDEEMFWEASWYERGEKRFDPVLLPVPGSVGAGPVGAAGTGDAMAGYLICTELWFSEHARSHGRGGAHLLAAPRATLGSTAEKWLAGGRAAAVVSGAYCLSSNRGGIDRAGTVWAGTGWIIEPQEGEILARTSNREPFVTLQIDLDRADEAKASYPRYVLE